MIKVSVCFGTRPEIIKLFPVIKELQKRKERIQLMLISTAQHRELVDELLEIFEIIPDFDLNVMDTCKGLAQLTSGIVENASKLFADHRPDVVVVQGDTTTVFSCALAAFYERIPVAHVEAGLRSHDRLNPFPEEMNRLLTTRLSSFHFAPTRLAMENLLKEGVAPLSIVVTGNTVVDAVSIICNWPPYKYSKSLQVIGRWPGRILLITAHRRETWGEPLNRICRALLKVVNRFPDVLLTYPVHPNPKVRESAFKILDGHERICLLAPLAYPEFIKLMNLSTLIVTDSGGVQEEAPTLKKPVVLIRNVTDRPESKEMGISKIVGTDENAVFDEISYLLENSDALKSMIPQTNPYGDGQAASRIADSLEAIVGSF